jgi:hypothetical protein
MIEVFQFVIKIQIIEVDLKDFLLALVEKGVLCNLQ